MSWPPESWYPAFEWMEATGVGTAVRQSVWAFPILEAVHLVGLALLGAAVLAGDLRLMGLGLTSASPGAVLAHCRPWLAAAVMAMAVTGIPMLLSEAVKCYYATAFWVKMGTLPPALALTWAGRRRLIRQDPPGHTGATRVQGAVSVLLWLTVAAAGRWIGFSA